MTGRERNLLSLFGAAALLSTCALWAFSSLERLREVDSSIDRYRGQLKRIEARASEDPVILDARIEELKKNVENLEKRSSGSGEGSGLAEFGARVRASLVAADASVLRYQPVRAGDKRKSEPDAETTHRDSHEFLEFSARGSPLALSRFLREAAWEAWDIPYLSVRSERDPLEFVVRIGHEH